MKVHGTWIIDLPIHLIIDNNSIDCISHEININDARCELIKNDETNYIDKIKVTVEDEYSDQFLPSYKNIDYLYEFDKKIIIKAGKTAQEFLDRLTRINDSLKYYLIFNGKEFVTKYKLNISPDILIGTFDEIDIDEEHIDFKTLKEIETYRNSSTNLAWLYLRDAKYFNDIGKHEMCIINMAIMLEFLIKDKLRNFLNGKGRYNKKHEQELIELYGKNPPFVDKYYKYGLSLLTSMKLDDELLETINAIYITRNDLAHGKRLEKTSLVNENCINDIDFQILFKYLIKRCRKIYKIIININL